MNSNDYDASNDPGNLTLAKFEAFIDTLDQPSVEQLKKAQLTLGALISDKPALTQGASVFNTARVLMYSTLLHANPALTPYIEAINDDAKELMYIEHCRKAYGDDMVNAALDDARTSYRTFYHAMQLRIMAKQLDSSFSQLREAFVAIGKSLAAGIAQAVEASASDVQPGNRHARRSRKHTRQMKEGDQQWARRNNPKRRR